MRLIDRIRLAEGQALRAAEAAETARRQKATATFHAVKAEIAAEDVEWYRALAERVEGDAAKSQWRKITLLEGLVIVAEQARDLAQRHALDAIALKEKR